MDPRAKFKLFSGEEISFKDYYAKVMSVLKYLTVVMQESHVLNLTRVPLPIRVSMGAVSNVSYKHSLDTQIVGALRLTG